ncbi:hypothetical protein IJE86_10325 [bacterium]|nr:hypothetical protein [bacterium]
MIQQLSINPKSQITNNSLLNKNQKTSKDTSFSGLGSVLTASLQACEQHPMIGVSVIDAATCIVPRAAVDFNTNAHAGLETLRRESSGLLVNCLLPSYIVMGTASLLKHLSVPKEYRHLGLASSWADEDTINKLSSHFKTAASTVNSEEKGARTKAFVRSVLGDLEGYNSSKEGNWVKYSTSEKDFDKAVSVLSDAIESGAKQKKAVSEAYRLLADSTHATETIRFSADNGKTFNSNLSSILRDVVDMGSKFNDKAVLKNIDAFSETAIKFVKQKSFAGLAVVLPLAASMQYINRWITRKKSGVKGAPIYRDFGSTDNKPKKEKDSSLWAYRIFGAGSIMGLAMASMMKKPSLKMFQFKGLFPTMDQARWIAAITFASRVLAAEDKNEVRESTFRDMAGFASLYFLGDYVAKGLATVMHKVDPSVDLINKHKFVHKDANVFTKFGNWIKNQSLKSFDEVPKELKTKRAVCQATSLGASMLLLGLFIPIWNRKQTEKNRAKELDMLKNLSQNKQSLLANGPESTMSLLWHKWNNKEVSSAFGGFEKITNFK